MKHSEGVSCGVGVDMCFVDILRLVDGRGVSCWVGKVASAEATGRGGSDEVDAFHNQEASLKVGRYRYLVEEVV